MDESAFIFIPIIIFFLVFVGIIVTILHNVKKAVKQNFGKFDLSILKDLEKNKNLAKKIQTITQTMNVNNELNTAPSPLTLDNEQIEIMITKELEQLKIKEFEPEKKKPEWMEVLGKLGKLLILIVIIVCFGLILRGVSTITELPWILIQVEEALSPYTDMALKLISGSLLTVMPFILIIIVPNIIINVARSQKKNAIKAYKAKGYTLFLTHEEMKKAVEMVNTPKISEAEANKKFGNKVVAMLLLMKHFKKYGNDLYRNITEMM